MRQLLQSRSVGDHRGVMEGNQLTWHDQKPAIGTAPEGESGDRKEGRGIGSNRRGRNKGGSINLKAKTREVGRGSIPRTPYLLESLSVKLS